MENLIWLSGFEWTWVLQYHLQISPPFPNQIQYFSLLLQLLGWLNQMLYYVNKATDMPMRVRQDRRA